jgi:hypothetical protein
MQLLKFLIGNQKLQAEILRGTPAVVKTVAGKQDD